MATKKGRKKQGRTTADSAAKGEAKSGGDRRKRFTTVVVALMAVLMVLSILLPSLSSILSGANATQRAASDGSNDSSDKATTQQETVTMDTVDEQYGALVKELKARLKKDPKNLAALLNLGNDYMGWASTASYYASDDAGKAHVKDLYKQAIDNYDEYLKLNDSNDVHVRRALCQYYRGDTDDALKALKEFTAGNGKEYGPAWAYLGVMYQLGGDNDKATSAYEKAIEVDKDDSYGAKSLASQQLAAMKAGKGNDGSATGQQSLESVLNSAATSGK